VEQEILIIINKEQVKALIDRLGDSSRIAPCIEEVKRMLEIKSTLLWRADAGSCCVGRELPLCLDGEVRMLENILHALEEDNVVEGISLLADYEKVI